MRMSVTSCLAVLLTTVPIFAMEFPLNPSVKEQEEEAKTKILQGHAETKGLTDQELKMYKYRKVYDWRSAYNGHVIIETELRKYIRAQLRNAGYNYLPPQLYQGKENEFFSPNLDASYQSISQNIAKLNDTVSPGGPILLTMWNKYTLKSINDHTYQHLIKEWAFRGNTLAAQHLMDLLYPTDYYKRGVRPMPDDANFGVISGLAELGHNPIAQEFCMWKIFDTKKLDFMTKENLLLEYTGKGFKGAAGYLTALYIQEIGKARDSNLKDDLFKRIQALTPESKEASYFILKSLVSIGNPEHPTEFWDKMISLKKNLSQTMTSEVYQLKGAEIIVANTEPWKSMYHKERRDAFIKLCEECPKLYDALVTLLTITTPKASLGLSELTPEERLLMLTRLVDTGNEEAKRIFAYALGRGDFESISKHFGVDKWSDDQRFNSLLMQAIEGGSFTAARFLLDHGMLIHALALRVEQNFNSQITQEDIQNLKNKVGEQNFNLILRKEGENGIAASALQLKEGILLDGATNLKNLLDFSIRAFLLMRSYNE